jgi:hypothetical protein
MLPKVASALARILDPIKPITRPGKSITLSKSTEGGSGGHGTLGYEAPPEDQDQDKAPEAHTQPESEKHPMIEDGIQPDHPEKKFQTLPFRPGLTQVILDLNSNRIERSVGAAAHSYETGAKEQKKNARLPKGSMLDKKVG